MKNKLFSGLLPGFIRVALITLSITAFMVSVYPVKGFCDWTKKDKEKKEDLEKPVVNDLKYLLDFVVDKSGNFDPSKVQNVIGYVDNSKSTDEMINLPRYKSTNGAGMRMEVNTGLKHILEYAYNPDIPNYAIYPSVIRISGWYPDSQFMTQKIKPWEYMNSCDTPKVWRGREYEVNTPDSFGGGYYKYDLERLMVMMKYQGRDVFLSVSRQIDKSGVGRKGLVVDDNQWNYFYSGIPGLSAGGIGWMDTYMYSSASVYVYIQDKNDPEKTTTFLFKWLKAGWAGLNVVRPKHIFEGSQRFAKAFKGIMESDNLPEPQVFARKVNQIESMTDEEINSKMENYSKGMEEMCSDDPEVSDKFPEVYKGGKYADGFDREERIGILVKEYVKQAMGKQCVIRSEFVEN
ncbi:hypothetical protein [Maridesulfovibrio bastinii]|uniref:hypothetical protein n=1 Tax=Maridesulfovibrio bastinii TaxID=47157 RepID=UPI00041ED65A|nr:hypothetical protein [Maridesulfovibrio bastinii]